ncbi:hypothetical protein EDC96DRAFT_506715 [Choanephora cucurbitarum]|nr:hypothetical protein EDC96DRAFT_506715 [Choanephora cucurbitarum]
MYDEPQSIFVFKNPLRFLSRKGRQIGAYLSGALLAIGWWVFLDGVILSGQDTTVLGFEDWFSGILSTLGMIVINLIDKKNLQNDSPMYAGSGLIWKARLFLFIGFSLIAGGLAGSFCVLILKYIIHENTLYYGVTGVIQNAMIMMSAAVLWVAQNTQNEYEYNVHL